MTGTQAEGRLEFKFVLPVSRREELLDLLASRLVPDGYAGTLGAGRRGYPVHSLYLDTPLLSDYNDRLQERRVRNRLRVRTYGGPGDAAPVFLENKRKLGRWTVKHRALVCASQEWCASEHPRPWGPLATALSGAGRAAAERFCGLVDGEGRVPVSVVHYEREAFVSERAPEEVRLTLDHRVRATVSPRVGGLFDRPQVDLIPGDWMVLEVKFGRSAPAWMSWLTRILRIPVVPVSKFGLSVARGLRRDRPRELAYLTPRPLSERTWAR